MWCVRFPYANFKDVRRGIALFSHLPFQLLLFLLLQGLTGCHEHVTNPNAQASVDDYAKLSSEAYKLSTRRVRTTILSMAAADSDSTLSDYYTRSHYMKRNGLVWVDRLGVDAQADSLAAYLRQHVALIGFNPEKFRLPQIEADLRRAHNLEFDDGRNTISRVYARLEYNLTKSFFRYAAGQRFGFVNPKQLYNKLDVHESASDEVSFSTLFALPCPTAGQTFYRRALHAVRADSLEQFIAQSEPYNDYYNRLLKLLHSDSISFFGRELVMINLERCRWRLNTYPWNEHKAVIVNIPSFRLMAVDGNDVMSMRIGCGSLKSKTPMLYSSITRMDINPQWIMPRSIVKKSIIPRLGNPNYFKSHNYFIRERATGNILRPSYSLRYGLESGDYLAIQEGGEGNALGRIIFRFNNDFSIYLHDTSSKDVFSRDDRDVSHGCVRVERPFNLAVFLLGNGHNEIVRKIQYSMHADVSPLGKNKEDLSDEELFVNDTLQKNLLIGSAQVRPSVPIYILYFTLYPNERGRLCVYRDVYGYDGLIYKQLENFI